MKEQISKEEIEAVYPKVAQVIADALGCDVDDVKLQMPLIEGLDAESIDFLDLVFRLERSFGVKIPRGKIVEDARGDLPEAEFEKGGIVTDAGLAQLREFLSEVPAERFKTPLKAADIPRLFTPETFCKVVIRAQRAVPAAGPDAAPGRAVRGMDGRFRAFSFVDRITRLDPGHRIEGLYTVPATASRFPAALMAEAVGQLAAWSAMSAWDSRTGRSRAWPARRAITARPFPGRRCI